MTNICCKSSARDAAMDNFRVVMLADANAARTDEDHMAAIATVARSFGDVQHIDEAFGDLNAAHKA